MSLQTFILLSENYFSKNIKISLYSFNGKEKDNEWNGTAGGALDFGARIYDCRVGRWLACDPLFGKYPSISPYASFNNNPNIFVDRDGKENVIYLTDLRLNDPKVILTATERAQIISNLYSIANEANKCFEQGGVTQRVLVIMPADIPQANKIDKSDVLATIGTTDELAAFDKDRANSAGEKKPGDYDIVGVDASSVEISSVKGDYGGDEGNRIGINIDNVPSAAKFFGVTNNKVIANTILHGSGHNSAIGHTDSMEDVTGSKSETHPKMGQYGISDFMNSGSYYQYLHPDDYKSQADFIPPAAKKLFTRADGKFTVNEAKDNVFNKPIPKTK